MPNHCRDTLILSASTLPAIIAKYVRKDGQGERTFDFEKTLPVGDVSVGKDRIDFFTAWTPPIPILKKLAEPHKDLVFRLVYYEPGIAFRGTAIAKWKDGGVLREDACWDMTERDLKDPGLVK
jgi:hypothetical protein